jgi:CubicO group peptidase (beta-lactamase class C family)
MGEPAPFQEFGRSDGDTPISGTVKPGFEAARDAFAANLDSGADIGAAAAVFIDGEPVVDLWGGYFDATYTRLWERDTIANGFSSTKTMTALCALLLADRGELDLNAPVKKYWPEFAAEGKERVEVRHLLGHASGVAGWSEPMTLADIYDWEKATTLLARQAPWWEPGTAGGYHAFNMGHLVGEVIRRITDLTTGKFLRVELAGRLNVEYYIGTPAERDGNVSLLIQGYPIQPKGNEFFKRALLNLPARPQDSWSIAWRRADLGALNGHGNAYAIAAIQSVLASGGLQGKQIMSERGRLRVWEEQASGPDLVLGIPLRWGMGYCLDSPVTPAWTGGRETKLGRQVAHWGGGGGSMSYVDLDARMAFGYTPNRWITGLHEQDRSMNVLKAVYSCLANRAH